MRHARSDYSRIQDPSGLIPEDEPVFLLRAQDKHAAKVLRFYAQLVYAAHGDPEIMSLAEEHADAMDAWPVHKSPDI